MVNMSQRPTVILLMRMKTDRYSIERLFESLLPDLANKFDIRIERVPSHGRNLLGFIRNLTFTSRLRADVIHVTGDIYYCALAVPSRRCILTVHDLASLNRLKYLRKSVFALVWFRLPLRRVSHVTAISEETRRELVRRFPFVEKKVQVVPNCVDEAFGNHPRMPHPGSERFRVLQVGTAENKNLDRVAAAASGLPLHLRIIGPLSEHQRKLLSALDLEWSSAGRLSNDEVVLEYQRSDALVFVSTYEGFGLPIVEAQAIGLPVITSSIEPMNSVAGNTALLVNPYNELDIRASLEQLLTSPNLSNQLIDLGRSNAKRFSAATVAEQYSKIYADIIKRK